MVWAIGLTSASCLAISNAGSADASLKTPSEVFKKSAAAIVSAKRLGYHAQYEATDWVKAFAPNVSGTVVVGKRSEFDLDEFYCNVEIKPDDSDKTQQFTAGSDGDVYFLIDSTTKTAYVDMDPSVLGSHGRDIQRVVVRELTAKKPFSEAIEDGKAELTGTRSINEEPCYEIRIKGDSPAETVWYLSTNDFLPRRIERIYKREGKAGSILLTLSSLVINPKTPASPFKLSLPKGFTKTDEFAP